MTWTKGIRDSLCGHLNENLLVETVGWGPSGVVNAGLTAS